MESTGLFINLNVTLGAQPLPAETAKLFADALSTLRTMTHATGGSITMRHESAEVQSAGILDARAGAARIAPLTGHNRVPQTYAKRDRQLRRFMVGYVRELRRQGADAIFAKPTKADFLEHFRKHCPALTPTNLPRDLYALTHEGRRFDPLFLFLYEGCSNSAIVDYTTQGNLIRSIMSFTRAADVEYQLRMLKSFTPPRSR